MKETRAGGHSAARGVYQTVRDRAKNLFEEGHHRQAIGLLGELLGRQECSGSWNDWATIQLAAGNVEEAEAAFRRALELNPTSAGIAANLGLLLASQKKLREAARWLERALASPEIENRAVLESLLRQCRTASEPCAVPSRDLLRNYLGHFCGSSDNERAYFLTHIERYLATLDFLPRGAPGQHLLELGAAFHHITPALLRWKGYADVRCADVWEGEAQAVRRVASCDREEELSFIVDNFDLHAPAWPYADASFDAVLFCEMLEHLICDPMHVMSEINRILKPDGLLLLTTPNVAGSRNVSSILRRETPYSWGQYEAEGRPTDRHNREYTPGEVERLAGAAGFEVVELETRDVWGTHRDALPRLAAAGFPIAKRGDAIFLLARKVSPVKCRFPVEFYLQRGTQQERRESQSDASALETERCAHQSYVPLRILVVHEHLPWTDQGGSEVRMMQILRELREQGHAVSFLARSGRSWERYAPPLEAMGIALYADDPARLAATGAYRAREGKIDEALSLGRFDLAILSQWFWWDLTMPEQYLQEIRRASPSTRIVILTDDQHGIRELALAQWSGERLDLERGLGILVRDLEVYPQADWVVCITEEDRRGILALNPELDIDILPMTFPTAVTGPSFAAREHLAFLGSFENAANTTGLRWFINCVWPEVHRRLPDVQLHLFGNGMPPEFAAPAEGIVGFGRVEDVGPVFDSHRVFVEPTCFGTGIKTKNLAAMAHGLPLVTTRVGAEGLGIEPGVQAMVGDDPRAFADAIVRVYRDETAWNTLAKLSRRHVQTNFSEQGFRVGVSRLIERARRATPRSLDEEFVWSAVLMEKLRPDLDRRWRTQGTVVAQTVMRAENLCQMAETLLAQGHFAEARQQLRNVFYFSKPAEPAANSPLFDRTFALLDRCSEQSPESGVAKRALELAASHHLDSASRPQPNLEPGSVGEPLAPALPNNSGARSASAKTKSSHKRADPFDISVLIPTYNRKETLRACLDALSSQTLPSKRFEVIVVDDGSSDGTAKFCRDYASEFHLVCRRRQNGGIGAARRTAVSEARGTYLLMINDDTIASPALLEQHLGVFAAHPEQKWAVLGNFHYSAESRNRALTHYFARGSFLFPQFEMVAGWLYGAMRFVTCNLSVPRRAVLAAGSFDPRFRVAEDTELGARLEDMGYRVFFHPFADAVHDHLSIRIDDIVHRARQYGQANYWLFRKHPRLLGEGNTLYGQLDLKARGRMETFVAKQAEEVEDAVRALRQFDDVDLTPFFEIKSSNGTAADDVIELFNHAVPAVNWFYLFQSLLETWNSDPAERRAVRGSGTQREETGVRS